MDKRFLTISEVAEALAISKSAVRNRIAAEEIPSTRIGERSVRVPAAFLDELEAKARRPRPSQAA